MTEVKVLQTDCCIAGGGPAGMMTGFLLARADIPVIVLKKHKDFFRDFRGDTIHPSTFQVIHELGLLKDFLQVPPEGPLEVNAPLVVGADGRSSVVRIICKPGTRMD